MFGRRRRRRQRWFEQGQADEVRNQDREALRRAGHRRTGEDTEPVNLSTDEREAYLAGRRSLR